MKHILLLTLLLTLGAQNLSHTFSTSNAPSSFERRYNANSFILNCKRYYKRYAPRQQSLGSAAIKKIKKNRK